MPPRTITSKTLFYGDTLSILREHIADVSEGMHRTYTKPPRRSTHAATAS